MKRTMQQALANLTDDQALAVWLALGQWADNTRCGVEEDPSTEAFIDGGLTQLEGVEAVVAKLDAVMVQLVEKP